MYFRRFLYGDVGLIRDTRQAISQPSQINPVAGTCRAELFDIFYRRQRMGADPIHIVRRKGLAVAAEPDPVGQVILQQQARRCSRQTVLFHISRRHRRDEIEQPTIAEGHYVAEMPIRR